MQRPTSQSLHTCVAESPADENSRDGSTRGFASGTAKYFDTWLKDLKPGFEFEKAQAKEIARPQPAAYGSELQFEGTLRIDGKISGSLRSMHGTLIVGETSNAEGEIRVAVAIIEGNFSGDIHASERVEIGPAATVIGNIHAPSMSIQPGAVFEGQCVFVPNASPRELSSGFSNVEDQETALAAAAVQ